MAFLFFGRRTRAKRAPPASGRPPVAPPAALVALALLLACAPSGGAERRCPPGPRFFGSPGRRAPPRRTTRSSRSAVSASASAVGGSALSGVPRGGGGGFFGGDRFPLFGRRRRKRSGGDDGDDDDGDDGGGRTLYPPLTREEIEEKLDLPAYCVTDAEGTGIAVMGDKEAALNADGGAGKGGGYVYLFLSRAMADEALRLAKAANEHLDGLKVTALHLGKVWFRLLHNDNVSVSMKRDGNALVGPEVSRKVRFRLVPGARDLVGARVLLGLNPPDAEALRVALEPSPLGDGSAPSDIEGARSIIERATHNSPAFRTPFDEVPVFLMPRMRVRRPEDGEDGPARLPLFLSSKNMVKTFLDMARENPEMMSPGYKGGGDGGGGADQPVVQLVELNRIVEMMQEESEMDFRNVVILPPVEDEDAGGSSDDDDSDDEDDGGGGDFGISAEVDEQKYVEEEFSPFVSMEVSVFGEGQELVPMQ